MNFHRVIFYVLLIASAGIALTCFGVVSHRSDIDPEDYNGELEKNHNIKSAYGLVCVCQPWLYEAIRSGAEKLTVTTEDIGSDEMKITAVIDVRDDDELKDETYLIWAQHKNGVWKILKMSYDWSIWDR